MESTTLTILERDQKMPYIIVPINGTDQAVISHLEELIKSVTGLSDIYSWTTDGELMWYQVDLTEAEATLLKGSADVDHLAVDEPFECHDAPYEDWPFQSSASHNSSRLLSERDQIWLEQEEAARELRVISTPLGKQWTYRNYFKYPQEAGEDIYFYHIEDVRAFQQRMFFGTTIAQGLKAVIDNLKADKKNAEDKKVEPTRYCKSIIIMSSSTKKTYKEVALDKPPFTNMRSWLSQLTNMGVPIVLAAGNGADEATGDVGVIQLPMWYSYDGVLPLINVGNADADGVIAPKSRRGDKVAIFANGKDVTCSEYTGSGTSFSAPQVGRAIAVGMSQKAGPFYEATKAKEAKPL
ncbi:hypothetical protein N7495_008537 [Penicillium taxi]|uniref:uncharacterized protein n=1 Tax=Penicillium taxi TaxID=168475 RepID=UPI00254545E4|nr:uncharacterized protein N7495_008537 [Penicillium taxi]KAJ5888496.1 hypothetical protein N7495_008537 [Penicillium taxi]